MLRPTSALPGVLASALFLAACPNPFAPAKKDPPPPPLLTSVAPPKGDVAGGQTITLRGKDLNVATEVLFGLLPATALTVSKEDNTELQVHSPAGTRGKVSVSVKGESGTSTVPDAFQYVVQAKITQVDPPKIPANAATTVTLRGTGLVGPVSVTVSSLTSSIIAGPGTDTAAPVSLPALDKGTYTLIATNGDNEISNNVQLEVTEAIRVNGVEPDGGFLDETTPVTITGSGFITQTSTGEVRISAVLFGTGSCTDLKIIDATTITCTAPVGAAGPVDVVVRRTPGDEGKMAGGFNYYSDTDSTLRVLYAAPKACSTTTTACPGAAGRYTDLKVTGLSLGGTPTVTIAGIPAPVQSTTTKTIRVTVPPYELQGLVHFDKVALGVSLGGNTVRKDGAFIYYLRPDISSITPDKAATVGGDRIDILGQGFGTTPNSLRVVVTEANGTNPQEATEVTRVNATHIQAKVPAHAPGEVAVKTCNEFDCSDLKLNMLEYVEAVRVTSLDPPRASIAGGTILVATGSGFRFGNMKVMVGENSTEISNVEVLDSAHLRVIMPEWAQAETVRFRVQDLNPLNPSLSTGDINLDYMDNTTRNGGVGGGGIHRNISVSVIRQDTGARISGAEVFVGNSWANAGVGLRRTTNSKGLVVLSTLDLAGPVTLVAAAPGFENQARVGLDASEVTFALLPYAPEAAGEPEYAQVSGYISNWAPAGYPYGAAPGQVKRLAVVYVSEPDVGMEPIYPGQFNIISEESCDITPDGMYNPLPQQFTVNAIAGTRIALVAAVYFYNAGPNGLCEPGTPQQPGGAEGEGIISGVTAGAMGLLTGIDVRSGTNPNNIIPINRTVTTGMAISLVGAPVYQPGVGNTARTVDAIWDLGDSGVFSFYGPVADQATIEMANAIPAAGTLFYSPQDFMNIIPTAVPAPGGDIKYILHGVSGQPVYDQNNYMFSYAQPVSEVWKRNVQNPTETLEGWFNLPVLRQPLDGQQMEGRKFAWNAFNQAGTFVTVDIGELVGDNVEPRWSLLLPGDASEVVIPDLSGNINLNDLSTGTNLWQLGVYQLYDEDGAQYNQHTNDQLGTAHWKARVLSSPVAFNVP